MSAMRMRSVRLSPRRIGVAAWIVAFALGLVFLAHSPFAAARAAAEPPTPSTTAPAEAKADDSFPTAEELESSGLGALSPAEIARELRTAAVRLPLAAALGALLAWRPRRRGSPPRQPAVIETQLVLAVIGALIMQVVGVSLARAFGIVGVASLIRYRSKINDPRDAVVMLSALAVGLAAGTGLFALALFSTLFLALLLWFVEGLERSVRAFELTLGFGEETARLRTAVERELRRFDVEYELRATAEESSTYIVTVPNGTSTSRLSKALAALSRDGKGTVEWTEKPKSLVA